MRVALLACLALASCGPARPPSDNYPRYLVLTTVPPDDPMDRHVARLAARRVASDVVRFRDLSRDRDLLLDRIREVAPSYVALVVRPAELDAAFQLAFLSLACDVDFDPFPDFTFGYFLAADPALLERQVLTLERTENKAEPRLLRATRFEAGAAASALATDRLLWASGLPLRRLTVREADLEFLRANRDAVERCDHLILHGEGSPDGVKGLPFPDLGLLRFDTTAIFSGVDATGAAGSVMDATGGTVRRRAIPREKSVVLTLMNGGASALFAPLLNTRPALAEREWVESAIVDAPFGDVMKSTYERAILSAGGAPPRFPEFREGAPPPGFGSPLLYGATRVLYGDPFLKPFARDTVPPVRPVMSRETKDERGDLVHESTWRVAAWDCAPFFADPFSDEQQIHLKLPCSGWVRSASLISLSAELPGAVKVPIRLSARAVEEWRGSTYVHVLLAGSGLAREDLSITLRMSLR